MINDVVINIGQRLATHKQTEPIISYLQIINYITRIIRTNKFSHTRAHCGDLLYQRKRKTEKK